MGDILEEMEFFGEMNSSLKPLDEKLFHSNPPSEINLFVIGLPRSGTTLLTQLVFNCFNVECTNHFVAKFWDVPLVGCYLSNKLFSHTASIDYNSKYGKSDQIKSPHEFSWFWQKAIQLDTDQIENYDPKEKEEEIDWEWLKRMLFNMNLIYKKPLIHKPLELVGYHLKRFSKEVPNSLFLYIERDLEDIAYSLAKGRLDYYGDLNKWWSSFPPKFSKSDDEPYWEEIPRQIKSLVNMYENQFAEIDSNKVFRLNYSDLCGDPESLVSRIKEFVETHKKERLNVDLTGLPETFSESKPDLDQNIKTKIKEGLEKLEIQNRES